MNITPASFEDYDIRRVYDEQTETWYFSVVDIIRALLQQPDFQAARNYWKVLKNRLNKEGSETVTKCNRLKLPAEDGKMRLTDVANLQEQTRSHATTQRRNEKLIEKRDVSRVWLLALSRNPSRYGIVDINLFSCF